jgi:hypothetical protein
MTRLRSFAVLSLRTYVDCIPQTNTCANWVDKLDAESAKPEGEWSDKNLLGAWARARKAWWEVTGELLMYYRWPGLALLHWFVLVIRRYDRRFVASCVGPK